jgi:nicotinamide riboside kinase
MGDLTTTAPSDFVEIAQGQLKLEDAATTGNTHPQQLLICDTCILTTWIWSEFLVGSQDVQLKELMESREHSYTLYILMNIDVCWIDDGTRLAPDTEWFHKRYVFIWHGLHICCFWFVRAHSPMHFHYGIMHMKIFGGAPK